MQRRFAKEVQLPDFPLVSIVTPTLNSARYLKEYFERIVTQNYPRDKIEMLIVDGGSTDSTLDIAKEYGAIIISRNDLRDNPEARKAVGIHKCKGEYVLFVDSDNIIPHPEWLKKMLLPLLRDEAVASQPLWFHYSKKMLMLNRYYALMGNADPVVYYLGKQDHMPYFTSIDGLPGEKVKKEDFYFIFKFTEKDLPTLGANGYMIKKEILLKTRCDEDNYFHIDINVDLIRQGYDRFALVEDDIIHLAFSTNSVLKFLRRRYAYMHSYHGAGERRYFIFSSKSASDKINLLKYILYSITIVKPLADSLRGYARIRDIAWFIHPLMCLGFLATYSLHEIRSALLMSN